MRETAKITGICNQKGGVGKTVTAVNLGIGLAREGKHVLLVDVDPQGSLTASLGYQHPDQLEGIFADVVPPRSRPSSRTTADKNPFSPVKAPVP